MPNNKPLELHPLVAARQEKERTAVKDFLEGALAGDSAKFLTSLPVLHETFALPAAFRRIAPETDVPMRIRKTFAGLWEQHGDRLRGEIGDDHLLIAGLRALMPPYRGGGVVVYRGDTFINRTRRTYGLSWSRSQSIADQHAQQCARRHPSGSALLQTTAPREAIICALKHHTGGIEDEYIIDRRRLVAVTILKRYPFAP